MKIITNCKMEFKAVEISKEEAQAFLDRNDPDNRKFKPSRIELYQRDMDSELWDLTWEPVVLSTAGTLLEGQNRLAAFIRSNLHSLPIVLCTGATKKAMQGAGAAMPRTIADSARIAGRPFKHGEIKFGAVAKRMMLGIGRRQGGGRSNVISAKRVLAFVDSHNKALEFAFDCWGGYYGQRGVTITPVIAVIARAYYRRNCRERIREFVQILLSGLPGNVKDDSAAVRLRNFLLDQTGGRQRRRGSYLNSSTAYANAETALDKFISREQVIALHPTKEELFPIPDDPLLDEPEAEEDEDAA